MAEVGTKTEMGKNLLKKIPRDTVRFLKIKLNNEITARIRSINGFVSSKAKRILSVMFLYFMKVAWFSEIMKGRSFQAEELGFWIGFCAQNYRD